jgi:hypothetical protein
MLTSMGKRGIGVARVGDGRGVRESREDVVTRVAKTTMPSGGRGRSIEGVDFGSTG